MKKLIFLFVSAMLFAAAAEEVFNEKKLVAEGQALERSGKTKEAGAFYLQALEKPLSPAVRRTFLNRCSMFAGNEQEKKDFLLRASMVSGASPTETYRTFLLLGFLHVRNAPDKALGYFLNFGEEKKVAPGLVYNGYLSAGRIMESQKKYQQALEYYRKSLTAGKAVAYKFNYSAAEEAIKNVEGLIQNENPK